MIKGSVCDIASICIIVVVVNTLVSYADPENLTNPNISAMSFGDIEPPIVKG